MSTPPLRIAVRKFSDFESALSEQLSLYESSHPGASFEAVPLDLHDLYDALFTSRGLLNGNWDLAFIVTDWLTEAIALGGLEDLSSRMQAQPLEDLLGELAIYEATVSDWAAAPECAPDGPSPDARSA